MSDYFDGEPTHADRLRKILKSIESVAEQKNSNGVVRNRPWSEALVFVPGILGFENGHSFIFGYLNLIEQTKIRLTQCEFRRTAARDSMLGKLDGLKELVTPDTFSVRTDHVLMRFSGQEAMEFLDELSDRLEGSDLHEQDQTKLTSALSQAEDTFAKLKENAKVSPEFRRLVVGYLHQLRRIEESYELLGEQDFWEAYSLLFAQFTQQHEDAFGGRKEKNEDLGKMLHAIVTSTSLAANAITLAGPLQGLLS